VFANGAERDLHAQITGMPTKCWMFQWGSSLCLLYWRDWDRRHYKGQC